MKKFKNKFRLFVITLLIIGLTQPISAYEGTTITPNVVVCTPGIVSYTQTSTRTRNILGTQGISTNNSGITQTYSNSVERAVFSSVSIGGNAELNYIAGKIGISTEVSAGITTTYTSTISVTVPPYSSITWSHGTRAVKSTGTMKYINGNCTYTNKSITADYSYAYYADWS
jgi:hypothetical protein